VSVEPREMKNCQLRHAKRYKNLWAFTYLKGWEQVLEVRPWGADFQVTTEFRDFTEGHKYVLYRPDAEQRRQIEKDRS
jgi:hypothetical protein